MFRAPERRGIEVIIAGAGWAASPARCCGGLYYASRNRSSGGLIGAKRTGTPLLSIVQMPPGIPVATMAIGKGGSKNAALYAASILALKYPDIRKKIKEARKQLARKVERGG